MFKVFVAHSSDLDTKDAAHAILKRLSTQITANTPPVMAGLLFIGANHDAALLLDRINQAFPAIELIGCTTDGEMTSVGGFVEDSVSFTLFCSDTIDICAGVGRETSSHPARSARDAIDQALHSLAGAPVLALTMPDGLSTMSHPMLIEMQSILGPMVPIVGGASADQVLWSKQDYKTKQFFRNEVLSDSTPVLLFAGPLLYSLGVQSGWSPLGIKKTVTNENDGEVYALDGMPPLKLYQHYLGDSIVDNRAMLGTFPLAVHELDSDLFYLRVASKADPETGFMTFSGDVPKGAAVQLTQAIRNQVIQGVNKSVNDARSQYPGTQPEVALTFSCTGRKMALGSKTYEEIERVMDILGRETKVTGFYTFGEIAPLHIPGQSHYHNATFVTLLLGTS
ncbi:MAG: FIST C-terminal domain-containing protein [Gammaproteobacteria bacterium]|nr:FIST C-terminal domain-containing protein [Gammaproteobacteria bacterium]